MTHFLFFFPSPCQCNDNPEKEELFPKGFMCLALASWVCMWLNLAVAPTHITDSGCPVTLLALRSNPWKTASRAPAFRWHLFLRTLVGWLVLYLQLWMSSEPLSPWTWRRAWTGHWFPGALSGGPSAGRCMTLAAAGGHVHKFLLIHFNKFLLIHVPLVVSFSGLERGTLLRAECSRRSRSIGFQRLIASGPQRRRKSNDNLGDDF